MAAAPAQARTTLHIEHTFAASRERVFEAWTETELLARWLRPPGGSFSNAEIDLRVGGAWSITMQAPLWSSGHLPRGRSAHAARLHDRLGRPAKRPESLVSVDFDELDR